MKRWTVIVGHQGVYQSVVFDSHEEATKWHGRVAEALRVGRPKLVESVDLMPVQVVLEPGQVEDNLRVHAVAFRD